MRSGKAPLTLALALVCACEPQADSSYQGEPLMTLAGQVKTSGYLPPLEAAMLWQRGPPPSTNDEELATRAPVQSGFPASFVVHLYQPAPAGSLKTLAPGEVTFARANAAAVPYGVSVDQVGAAASPGSNDYGLDANHWVIYLAADVPKGSLMEWWLGVALPKGFHLMRALSVNPACIKDADLQACLQDLVSRGVPDDGTANSTARAFCLEPYKLQLAPPNEELLLDLGAVGLGPAGGTCP